mgnify:CR=1 FL=1
MTTMETQRVNPVRTNSKLENDMTKIRKKSLWIDENQGQTEHDRAFGFVGTSDVDDYQGWFFTWPGPSATISTVAEREAVIESLDADETCPHEPTIPRRWARQKLEKYLRESFDMRSNA